MNDKDKELNKDKLDENESNIKEEVTLEEVNEVGDIEEIKKDNESNIINSEIEPTVKNTSRKNIVIGGCILALGLGALALTQISNNSQGGEFEDFVINNSKTVDLEFTIKDDDIERNRTSQEMREFYTPEGEEFIKTLYPDTSDSDFALVTVGKSISKEFSNIEFTTASNEKVKLENFKGKKIILDFALTTCPSCQEELSYLSTKSLNEDEVLLHIFPRNTTEEIKKVYKDLGIEFDNKNIVSSTGMNGLTFEDFNITHVPTKIYINEDGIVTYISTNTLSDNETYDLHYDRAFGEGKKMLDFLMNK